MYSSVDKKIIIKHSGKVIDALSCNLNSLTEQLESTKNHAINQYTIISGCLKDGQLDKVLKKKMLLLLNDTICIDNHIIKQNELLRCCEIEIKNARKQGLIESTLQAVENSKEYKLFQEDCNSIKSGLNDVKSFLEEQKEMLNNLEILKQNNSKYKFNIDNIDQVDEEKNLTIEDHTKITLYLKQKVNDFIKTRGNKSFQTEFDPTMKLKFGFRLQKLNSQKNITYYNSL